MPKLCKDCKWFNDDGTGAELAKCVAPQNPRKAVSVSRVTGVVPQPEYETRYCENHRRYGFPWHYLLDVRGKSGRWFVTRGKTL
jgi:hypothetical protein